MKEDLAGDPLKLVAAAALALLFLPAAVLTEALAFQSGGSAAKFFAKRFAARSVGFLVAWLVFSAFLGGGTRGTCWWSRT